VLVAEAPERDDAAGGHPADAEAVRDEHSCVLGGGEPGDDRVDLANRLADHLEGVFGLLAEGVGAFAVTGEVDGAGGDASAEPALEAAGVELLVGGAAVHPDHEGRGGRPVGVDEEGRDLLAERRREPDGAGEGLQGAGEVGEPVDHRGFYKAASARRRGRALGGDAVSL
jgi:hypothetical protein